jgi:hypothetical protein
MVHRFPYLRESWRRGAAATFLHRQSGGDGREAQSLSELHLRKQRKCERAVKNVAGGSRIYGLDLEGGESALFFAIVIDRTEFAQGNHNDAAVKLP